MKAGIIVVGCHGRMGKRVCNLLASNPNMRVAAGVDNAIRLAVDYPLYEVIADVPKADCIISLLPPSAAEATAQTLDYAAKHCIPLVICTTGLDTSIEAKIRKTSETVPIIHSSNMSLGADFLAWMLGKMTKPLYDAGFDVEIIESHHSKKQDAPSGTATALGEVVLRELDGQGRLCHGRDPESPPRKKGDIGVHAIRAGGIVGQHSVLFASEYETITISHTALSRDVFAVGAIAAAEFLIGKPPGVYSMADLRGTAYE